MDIVGIIPARYASTRFPGKPLAEINGKSMIRRVYEQALQARSLKKVVVATDDERIFEHVKQFGGEALITSTGHQSGTERCLEAAEMTNGNFQAVINIQGDEPFIHPDQINEVATCFSDTNTQIATLVKKIVSQNELENPNQPKVVLNEHKEAVYFSRTPIPYVREWPVEQWLQHHTFYRHIGIYGYRMDVLKKITGLPPSPAELAEGLEQLRWIAHNYKIKTAVTTHESAGVDTPEDLERLRDR